ncbi:rhamnosyltransferase [Paenibacillus taihuensis]|uniref:Rhamnosyltransferase n=1 Tax=Paenibacillus taihuensis TaxID=1156355 RepID=A0A3D9SN43_9BACL|nr:glycosyltransferase family 2 protein [Paenibacillus taihuensis]REE90529.1 rhamnosyltransferase [Paenibacillus taihuensis]
MHIDSKQQQLQLSVIIPTYNAGHNFKQLLTRLQSQSLRPCEIIVVDSSSTDGTAEIALQAGVRVLSIKQSEFDHGGTRNWAAEHTTGDIVVFMTQDAWPADDQLLEELAQMLTTNRELACVYGRQLAREDATVIEKLVRFNNYPPVSSVKSKEDIPRFGLRTFFCSNVCAAYRKDMFIQLGKFDAPVIFNEDMFFAARSILNGYQVGYCATAEVVHSHNYTLKQQFKRFFDNGISMRRNAWIMPYSAVGGAGMQLIKTQLRYLCKERRWLWVPRVFTEAAAKFLGFQLGKRYEMLPKVLCRRFSLHPNIWQKLNAD